MSFCYHAPYFTQNSYSSTTTEFGNPIEADTVVFGEEINLSDFSVSWGSVDAGYSGFTQILHQTLDINWQPGSVLKIALPREDEGSWLKADFGIEFFEFADGSRITMVQMLALAGPSPEHAPTINAPLEDQVAIESMPFSLTLPAGTFLDQDAGDILTYSLDYTTYPPYWLIFNPETRIFSGTPRCQRHLPSRDYRKGNRPVWCISRRYFHSDSKFHQSCERNGW